MAEFVLEIWGFAVLRRVKIGTGDYHGRCSSDPSSNAVDYDLSSAIDRQAMVDAVLGTMGAEGEPPSEETQSLMRRFVLGEISLDEMSNSIFEHATRMVHEANDRRLAVVS
jgi:hypothetical protein